MIVPIWVSGPCSRIDQGIPSERGHADSPSDARRPSSAQYSLCRGDCAWTGRWINVTANPTAEWVARQITEAFPWDEAPHYLIRDRDWIYGSVVTRRLRAMGIRDKPSAPAAILGGLHHRYARV
jgi:hypothetical protein